MIHKIEFEKHVHFDGRNGYFQQGGVEVYRSGGIIYIHPLTSKGVPARCEIQIPVDNVEGFIDVLRDDRCDR